MNEAAIAAAEEKYPSSETASDASTIKTKHFEEALRKVSPSVSDTVWLILLYFFHTLKLIPYHGNLPWNLFRCLDQQRKYYQHLSESFKVA